MLNQLIESRNHREENRKRGGFLFATFLLTVIVLSSGVLWSLFAKNISVGSDSLELSAIVAPIPTDIKPPEPIRKEERREKQQVLKNAIATRQINMARLDEVQPAPTEISVTPNTQKPRPVGAFRIDTGPEIDFGSSSVRNSQSGDKNIGTGIERNSPLQSEVIEKAPGAPPPPPIIKKKAEEPAVKPQTIVSDGVINGKAKFLPKPAYSSAAIAVNAKGDVNVQVTIDEQGNVISAKAINGHPLLRDSAERAARSAKFSPTLLSKQPVKVSGIIVYKFAKN